MRSVVGFRGPAELGGFAEGSFLAAEPPPRSFPVETGGAGVCASVCFTPQVSSELRPSAAAIRVRRQSPGGFALCVSGLEKWVKSHVFWLKIDKILVFMCGSVHKRRIVALSPPSPSVGTLAPWAALCGAGAEGSPSPVVSSFVSTNQ